jgi:hypothetical protein
MLVALLTAVAVFLAALASQSTAVRSTERTIRRAPPVAHAIVAYRVAAASSKARVAGDSLDALPLVAMPVSASVRVFAAQIVGRVAIADGVLAVASPSDLASRARGPPIG